MQVIKSANILHLCILADYVLYFLKQDFVGSPVLHPQPQSSITEVLCQLTACAQATGRYGKRKGEKECEGDIERQRERERMCREEQGLNYRV